ncbi:hypothetical protein PNOK_0683700 [Pyrrhoderma noxium]|uniref:Uncharacterized protein n=1 Tax=Pyrrhoderma noxium TaxID=2282107 RepID=A0A286UFI3_9AGAM|nr:hypothetical protein PNOK_0683700 [Pyrrhoderma noxium]
MQDILDELEHQTTKLRKDIEHHKKRAAKIYDEDDLLPVYMHGKGTREDPCYFDKELPSEDDDNDEEMEINKVDEENKENIPDNEPPTVRFSNEKVQTSPIQEEEYSWTSNSDKQRVAIMNHAWSLPVANKPRDMEWSSAKSTSVKHQEPAPEHNWWSCGEEGSDKQGPVSGIA